MHLHKAAAASATLATRVTSRRAARVAAAATALVLAFPAAHADAAGSICGPRATFGHRADDSDPGEENTVRAAERMFRQGVTGAEVDVWLTAPEPRAVTVRGRQYAKGARQLVLVHDNTYARTHGKPRAVSSVPWSTAADWRTVTGAQTATLREMAELIARHWPGRRLLIQLKGTGHFDAPAIKRMLTGSGVDLRKVWVYKSAYRPLDRAILADFTRAGFTTGLKEAGGRPPSLALATDGHSFITLSAATLHAEPGSPEQQRISDYARAGLKITNAAHVSQQVIDDPRLKGSPLIIHGDEIARVRAMCGAS